MLAFQIIKLLARGGQHAGQHLGVGRAGHYLKAVLRAFGLGQPEQAEAGFGHQKAGHLDDIMMPEAHGQKPQLGKKLVDLAAH